MNYHVKIKPRMGVESIVPFEEDSDCYAFFKWVCEHPNQFCYAVYYDGQKNRSVWSADKVAACNCK